MNIEQEQEYAAKLRDQGKSQRCIADELGITRSAVRSRLAAYDKRASLDPYVRSGLDQYGVKDLGGVNGGWLVKSDGNGGRLSLNFSAKQIKTQSLIEHLADAFGDIPPYEPMTVTPRDNDELVVYPLFDAHFGMKAWGKETGGQDYDLKHAERDIKQAFTDITARLPDADTAILILGGDTLHADDNDGHTQSRNHVVDTDGRLYKTSDVAINAISWVIDHLCRKHARVIIRVLRGNHDEHSHIILHFALANRYRGAQNITFESAERDTYWYRHGISFMAFHHGDKRKAQDLALHVADTCADWSLTRDRHIFTGHIHHDSVKDFAGVKVWSLRAFCPSDKYGHMFSSRRALQAVVFSKKYGHVMSVIEPIMRGD